MNIALTALSREESRIMLWTALQQRFKKPAVQVSLGLVGTLLLIAGLGILVLRPTLLTISSLIKEIQDEEKLVKALDDKFRALAAAQGFLEDMKDDLPRIDWAIPQNQEFGLFAKEVEIMAKEKGLAAVEISQAGFEMTGKDGGIMEVWLGVGGSEEQVRNFLAELIKMDRLVLFKSVNVSAVSKDQRQDEPYQVKGSATVEILYSSENSENTESQKFRLSENQITRE